MHPHKPTVATHLHALAEMRDVTRVAVAFGVFDGVHRGHRKILENLAAAARQTRAAAVAVSFQPHPRAVLTHEKAPLLLTRDGQRARLLVTYGADAVVMLPFTHALANLGPEEFLEEHLFSGPPVDTICVGTDWRFGRKGTGNVDRLKQVAKRYHANVLSIDPFTLYGKPVSSTRIRDALTQGRLHYAERLLGRPYAIEGPVVHGKGIGAKTLGCPTANVQADGMVLPPPGVYAVIAHIQERPGKHYGAIAYIGRAPTINRGPKSAQTPCVETHIFDFHGDLYERKLHVQFVTFIRADRTFETVKALQRQMQADISKAKQVTRTRRRPRRT